MNHRTSIFQVILCIYGRRKGEVQAEGTVFKMSWLFVAKLLLVQPKLGDEEDACATMRGTSCIAVQEATDRHRSEESPTELW